MKTIFHIILFRPKGSKCWTPVAGQYCGEAGNFFANPDIAAMKCEEFTRDKPKCWLKGVKEWTAIQFKVAEVVIHDDIPTEESEDPSPNHQPPLSA